MNKDFVNALNDVLGFDVSDMEQCLDNGIGFRDYYETKEEAAKKCIEVNTLGNFFGWEKVRVYEWRYGKKLDMATMGYVCMTESEAEKMQNEEEEYKPL